MTTFEMLARLATGVGLGVAIGLERQYRARMAGLRTNALVCAGATLFVLLSAHGFHGGTADPTRVAAQIVSGIGFLGAGVIMREGASVRGLNTAATLWCSAAIGALAGAGMYGTAAAGTVAVVAVNTALRWAGRAVDRHPDSGREQRADYLFTAVTDDAGEAHVRALLVQALARTDFRLVSVSSRNLPEPEPGAAAPRGRVQVCAALSGDQRDDRQMESAVSRLSLEPSVTSVGWSVPDTSAAVG
ncbi:MgtC/SapB family protein [Nocardia wallacei]|uniref:Membrane protein n=1 Tax=Nocardia wallacei TaxID=480035 RepID=A0A7G1KKV4_9NOCA|nr:MgtC/SapB family protein [Nocardia wallacei]BCK55758.1 membrane protein [Nocardia wallacei]